LSGVYTYIYIYIYISLFLPDVGTCHAHERSRHLSYKRKIKNQQIVIDWDKWLDPDDEPEEDKGPGGDFDPSM
jgi:hypothetical protein